MNNSFSKWSKFSSELSKIIHFWGVGALFFLVYRIIFILFFHFEIEEKVHLADYFKVLFTGFRFDAVIISYFTLIPFISLLLLSFFNLFNLIRRIRLFFQSLFIILSSLISIVSFNYYMEFKNTFDNNLFTGLFEEDKGILAQMIWEYKSPLLNLFFLLAIITLFFWIISYPSKNSRLTKVFSKKKRTQYKGLVVIFSIFCMVSGLRGTFGKNILRIWNSAVTTDLFLNKAVLNPFKSLEVAYKDYKESYKLEGENPYTEKETTQLFPCKQVHECIMKETDNIYINKPKQIFLVIMESYDAWSLLDKYRPLHVSDNLCRIADQGISFMNFLPAHNSTIFAYSTIVSGVPHIGVNLSQINKKEEQCISSIYEQFKKLGYQTNFFYGGYLSWQKIDDFSNYLGCDNAYSAANMEQSFKEGCWGVQDEDLFNYVLDVISADEYSLNVILTGSFHPPFSVDVNSKGYPYHTKKDLPEEVRTFLDEDIMSIYELGHRWYGDYAIGQFMEGAEKKYPDALYAFTGDHYARNFINSSPNLYERSAVPFILYGKNIPAQKLNTPGSHIDIIPTLVELVAPQGFKYYSFGTSMFAKDKYYGLSYDKFITSTNLYHTIGRNSLLKHELNTEQEKMLSLFPYKEEFQQTMGIAWHYVAKGNEFTTTSVKSRKSTPL